MRQLWVDFNDIDERGHTTTLARFVEPGTDLTVGLTLRVGDDDGHVCMAEVVEMASDDLVTLALDMSTFRHVGRHARVSA